MRTPRRSRGEVPNGGPPAAPRPSRDSRPPPWRRLVRGCYAQEDRPEGRRAGGLLARSPQWAGEVRGMMLALGVASNLGTDDALRVGLSRSPTPPRDTPAPGFRWGRLDALDLD